MMNIKLITTVIIYNIIAKIGFHLCSDVLIERIPSINPIILIPLKIIGINIKNIGINPKETNQFIEARQIPAMARPKAKLS